MGVKFNNIKYLDRNNYNKIIIIENRDVNEYIVNVYGRNKHNSISSLLLKTFSKKIKYFSDEVKIAETVRYFLNNHKINSIRDEEIVSGYNGYFSCIHSNNCYLALRVFSNPELLNSCTKKYLKDRDDYLEASDNIFYYELWTRFGESSYHQYETSNGIRTIFHFKISKGNLWELDKHFLKKLIYKKLQEQGEIAKLVENFDEVKSKLICGKLLISFSDEVLRKTIEEVMNDYNESLEKEKILKLKMEGF